MQSNLCCLQAIDGFWLLVAGKFSRISQRKSFNWIIINEQCTLWNVSISTHVNTSSHIYSCSNIWFPPYWDLFAQTWTMRRNFPRHGKNHARDKRDRYATASFHFTAQLNRVMGWKQREKKGFPSMTFSIIIFVRSIWLELFSRLAVSEVKRSEGKPNAGNVALLVQTHSKAGEGGDLNCEICSGAAKINIFKTSSVTAHFSWNKALLSGRAMAKVNERM